MKDVVGLCVFFEVNDGQLGNIGIYIDGFCVVVAWTGGANDFFDNMSVHCFVLSFNDGYYIGWCEKKSRTMYPHP